MESIWVKQVERIYWVKYVEVCLANYLTKKIMWIMFFQKQNADLSKSHELIVTGDFNYPDVCWEINSTKNISPRNFLIGFADNFLLQRMREGIRGST